MYTKSTNNEIRGSCSDLDVDGKLISQVSNNKKNCELTTLMPSGAGGESGCEYDKETQSIVGQFTDDERQLLVLLLNAVAQVG